MSVNGAILGGWVPGGAPLQGEPLCEKERVTEQGEQRVSVDWGEGTIPVLYMREYGEELSGKIPKELLAVLGSGGEARMWLVKITFHCARSGLCLNTVTSDTHWV